MRDTNDMAKGGPVAQTTVQFLEQLQARGFDDADLVAIRRALVLAMKLFAGCIHPSGKLYLAHAIGAASTLAAIHAPTALVVAALVHDAYGRGDFGPWSISPLRRRAHLRRQIGAIGEELVWRFARAPWTPTAWRNLSARAGRLDPIEAQVVLLRLACDLDEVRDRALLYRRDASEHLHALAERRPMLLDLATTLGHPGLGRILAEAIDDLSVATVPAALAWNGEPALVIAPRSARLRPVAGLLRWLASPPPSKPR